MEAAKGHVNMSGFEVLPKTDGKQWKDSESGRVRNRP